MLNNSLKILRSLDVQLKLKMLISPRDKTLNKMRKDLRLLRALLKSGSFVDTHYQKLQDMVKNFKLANFVGNADFEPFAYEGEVKNENN